jgi:hypothetical protein
MASNRRFSKGSGDTLHYRLADRPDAILGSWILAIPVLFAGFFLLVPDWLGDRDLKLPAPPPLESVSGTGDVLVDDRTFAPSAIAARPNDRLVFRNVGEEAQALSLVGRDDILQEQVVESGASFTFVIPPTLEPGLYRLSCTTHPNRCLALVVKSHSGIEPPDSHQAASLKGDRVSARVPGGRPTPRKTFWPQRLCGRWSPSARRDADAAAGGAELAGRRGAVLVAGNFLLEPVLATGSI